MSALNGDKSRFHRERKQKLARRKRTRELLKATPVHTPPNGTAVRPTAHTVTA
jgi:hypothetical protein